MILGFFQAKNEESIRKAIFGNLNGECIASVGGLKRKERTKSKTRGVESLKVEPIE